MITEGTFRARLLTLTADEYPLTAQRVAELLGCTISAARVVLCRMVKYHDLVRYDRGQYVKSDGSADFSPINPKGLDAAFAALDACESIGIFGAMALPFVIACYVSRIPPNPAQGSVTPAARAIAAANKHPWPA